MSGEGIRYLQQAELWPKIKSGHQTMDMIFRQRLEMDPGPLGGWFSQPSCGMPCSWMEIPLGKDGQCR
jgi:hypothetical protein